MRGFFFWKRKHLDRHIYSEHLVSVIIIVFTYCFRQKRQHMQRFEEERQHGVSRSLKKLVISLSLVRYWAGQTGRGQTMGMLAQGSHQCVLSVLYLLP